LISTNIAGFFAVLKPLVSPTYQRFLKPLKYCDIVKKNIAPTACYKVGNFLRYSNSENLEKYSYLKCGGKA